MTVDREAWKRLRAELAVPFRGGRSVLWDLLAGSRVLVGRWWQWTGAADTGKQQLERIGGSLAAAGVAMYEVHLYAVVCAPAVVVAWSVGALMLAPVRPRRPAPRLATTLNDQEIQAGEQQPNETEAITPEAAEKAMLLVVEQTLAIAKSHGKHGTHLSTILSVLHTHGRLTHWTVTDLGAYLRHIGVPVRDSVRVGQTTRVGVHWDDLRRHLSRAPHLPPHMVPDLTPAEAEPEASAEGVSEVASGAPAALP